MTRKHKDILLVELVLLIASSIFGMEGIICVFIGECIYTGWVFFG